MTYDNESALRIQEYIDVGGADTGNKQKVPYRGEIKEMQIYKIPLYMLNFNLENTRFEIQKLKYEKEHGGVDPRTPEGKKKIIQLLLYDDNKLTQSAKTLYEDIKKNKQREAGVMTYDGAVINGNRRLACLLLLQDEEEGDTYSFFEVSRLPRGATPLDYFKIEADYQWAKDFKENYTPVNRYMMLKKALDFNLSPKEIIRLTRLTTKEVKEMTSEWGLINEYLESIKCKEDYTKIEQQTEIFTDAAKYVTRLNELKEAKKEIVWYKELVFHLVNLNQTRQFFTHRDIREINNTLKSGNETIKAIYSKTMQEKNHEVVGDMLVEAKERMDRIRLCDRPKELASTIERNSYDLLQESKKQEINDEVIAIITKTVGMLNEIIRLDKR